MAYVVRFHTLTKNYYKFLPDVENKEDATVKKRKRRTTKTSSCPYFTNTENKTQLTGSILSDVLDIEEIVKKGKEIHACPYYATR